MPTNRLLTSLGREWYHSAPIYTIRALAASFFGSYETKERLGLFKRPEYAYGIFRAWEAAKFLGRRSVVVCEFGVGRGGGLLNLIELAEQLRASTGMQLRVVGFDTGEGLTNPRDYRDHPELWSQGDYRLPNREEFMKKIEGRGEVFWGPIRSTLPTFLSSVSQEAPIGFVAVDVDFYSSAIDTLGVFLGDPLLYVPALSCYFDDADFFSSNQWCGENAAVRDFNSANSLRKIDKDYTLPGYGRTMLQKWYSRMFVGHILDHPARQPRGQFSLSSDGPSDRSTLTATN